MWKRESKKASEHCLTQMMQVGAFSDALGRAREDAGVQQLIKDPQVKKSSVSLLSRALSLSLNNSLSSSLLSPCICVY